MRSNTKCGNPENLDFRWAEQGRIEADRAESCRNSSPSRVMEYGIILLQYPRNTFMKGDTFLHNENRPFPLQNNTSVQHSNVCFFSSYFTQLCIYTHRLSKLMRYTSQTTGTCGPSVCPGTLSVANHSGLTRTHTHSSGGFERPSNRKHD